MGTQAGPEGKSLNPLADLTDVQLWNTDLMLALGCGRNHSSLTRKRRQYYCLLRRNLKVEADLRGLPTPEVPYGVGQLRHDPDTAL